MTVSDWWLPVCDSQAWNYIAYNCHSMGSGQENQWKLIIRTSAEYTEAVTKVTNNKSKILAQLKVS